MKLTIDYIILYRLTIIIIYCIASHFCCEYFFPNENQLQLLCKLKYFTVITMILNILYFMTVLPSKHFKEDTLRGYEFLVAFSFNMTMMLIYWSILFYDSKMITEIEDLKNMPLWFNNLCHLFPPITLIIDAYLIHPKIVSLQKALIIVCSLGIIYNVLIEIGIVFWKTCPYEDLLKYTVLFRYFSYAAVWLIVMGFMLIGEKFLHNLHNNPQNKKMKTK
ncbi:hypothetical protein KSF78_0008601 [Schistosoma japonicum]|nr:hypothetical protein KSF78_0008601 [Schistosoma japonicum]